MLLSDVYLKQGHHITDRKKKSTGVVLSIEELVQCYWLIPLQSSEQIIYLSSSDDTIVHANFGTIMFV